MRRRGAARRHPSAGSGLRSAQPWLAAVDSAAQQQHRSYSGSSSGTMQRPLASFAARPSPLCYEKRTIASDASSRSEMLAVIHAVACWLRVR